MCPGERLCPISIFLLPNQTIYIHIVQETVISMKHQEPFFPSGVIKCLNSAHFFFFEYYCATTNKTVIGAREKIMIFK